MGRPKGSKNKSVVEKIEQVIEVVAEQHDKSTDPVERQELAEAVEELSEVIVTRDVHSDVEVSKVIKLKGRHPVTKEPVYLKVK